MEMIWVTKRIPLEEFKTMTERRLVEYVQMNGTKLIDIKIENDEVVLTIERPVTWKFLLLHPILIPYRYM